MKAEVTGALQGGSSDIGASLDGCGDIAGGDLFAVA